MRIEKFISLIQENNSPEIKESSVVPENIHEIKSFIKPLAKVGARAAGITPKGGFFKTLGSEIKKNYGVGGKSLRKSVVGRYAGSEQNKETDKMMRQDIVGGGMLAGEKAKQIAGGIRQAVRSQIDTTKQNLEKRREAKAERKAERAAAKFAKSPEGREQARQKEMKARVLANIEKSKEARLADPAMDRAMAKSANRMATRRAKEAMTDAERRDFDKISAYRAKYGIEGLRKKALEDPRVMTFIKRTRRAIGAETGRIVGNTGRDVSNKGRYIGNQPRQT